MRFSLTQAMLAVALSFTILSCDKDDDDNPIPPTPTPPTPSDSIKPESPASFNIVSPNFKDSISSQDLPLVAEIEFTQSEGFLDSIYVKIDSINALSDTVTYYQQKMFFPDSTFAYTLRDTIPLSILSAINRAGKFHRMSIYTGVKTNPKLVRNAIVRLNFK